MELVSEAIVANADRKKLSNADMFIEYSPHVNQLSIRFYMTGWKKDADSALCDTCRVYLGTPENIQEAYWFIHNRKGFII